MHWFVNVQNQVYGPYSESQMQAFTMEGRITAHSLISNAPAQGFYAAIGYDAFALWSGTGQVAVGGHGYGQAAQDYEIVGATQGAQIGAQPSTPEPITPEPTTPEPSVIPEAPTIAMTPETTHNDKHVFLIMAEIRSDGAMAFLQKLQGFGAAQKLSDNIWLVKSAHSVEQLRNSLSQCLNRQDRLFILDAATNTPAWFNIGADLDNRIRDLWSEDEL